MSDLFSEDTSFTVSQITGLIKSTLEESFYSVTVSGEISNFKLSSTGHWYFTLKDETAAISAVMFKGKSFYVPFQPADGMLVEAKGSISVYPQRGTYQIIVETIKQAGTGNILQIIEERKQKLAAEGLFDESNKKEIPSFPKVIGVITSPSGAALQDILNIRNRRNDSVGIIVLPCPVQGSEAAEEIVKQIKTANKYNMADTLIVGRGGGSLEDLLPFSEEIVVRAVAESHIPIISAVGHEIDFALSDFAADLRAPTPSAAAELAIPQKADILNYLSSTKNEMLQSVTSKIEKTKIRLSAISEKKLEVCFNSIHYAKVQQFETEKEKLLENMKNIIESTKKDISFLKQSIENGNPKAILSRGYSIVKNQKTGKVITSTKNIKQNDLLKIISSDGIMEASVTNIGEKETL